jgi:hypothetical protein
MDDSNMNNGNNGHITPSFCINAYQDGLRNMDTAMSLYIEKRPPSEIESKIRPISGINLENKKFWRTIFYLNKI